MQLDQLLHQREADAAAFVGAAARVLRTRWKRSKRCGSSSRRDADAGVADRQLDAHRRRASAADCDLALEGELEGVGEQVEDDLLPHVAVDVDGLRQRRGSRR